MDQFQSDVFVGVFFVMLLCILVCVANVLKSRAHAEAADAALEEMKVQRDYWRGKAESMIDAALVRAGAIHQPTMETRGPLAQPRNLAAMVSQAMNVTEFDSSKGRK